MRLLKYIAHSSNLLFLLAITIGALLPQAASIGTFLTLPALAIILTVTLLRFPRGFFRKPSSLAGGAIWGNVMNYLVLGNLIILASIFLIRDEVLWIGMVLVAAVPPAVAIIPLGEKLQADNKMIFAGVAGTHLGALLIAPLIGLGFFKFIPFHYDKLILLIVGLILLPLVLSRLAIDKDWDKPIEKYEGTIIDWCFFTIFYTLTANSRDLMIKKPLEMLLISVIAVTSIVLITVAVKIIGRVYGINRDKTISLLLLGTIKNYGLAGGIALYVFNTEAVIPALVFSFFMFIYTIWIKYTLKNVEPADETKNI